MRKASVNFKSGALYTKALSLLYGMRITNNWLKMHGGIMARNGGKKKKRRLF